MHAPLPTSGPATVRTTLTDVWDKGKAAVIWQETTVTTPDRRRRCGPDAVDLRARRGRLGRRPRSVDASEPPDRAPDSETTYAVSPQQALLYRLCGDRNPLHSDPDFAAAAGFPGADPARAVLLRHACNARYDALLDGDPTRVGGFGARFAGVVFPGETLKASVWKEGDGFRAVVTAPERDDAVALAGVELVPV